MLNVMVIIAMSKPLMTYFINRVYIYSGRCGALDKQEKTLDTLSVSKFAFIMLYTPSVVVQLSCCKVGWVGPIDDISSYMWPSYVGTKPEPRRQYSPSNDLAVRCLAEMGVTRKSKDYVDCEKFITWFQERNPFNFKDEHLHSLSSGLVSKTTHDQEHSEKVFVSLMLQGKVSAALKWIGSQATSVFDINDEVCAGLSGGVETAIHAARKIFEGDETEAIILVDADNAFNSLNRKVALNNIQRACPVLATYLINTYRSPADLFISNSDKKILSKEGATQGDNSAMGFYSCSTIPLSLKKWWDELCESGPLYEYFPKPSKTWVIVKPEFLTSAKENFPELNITDVGHKYLGSYIGTKEGTTDFISAKVDIWIEELSRIATREPQVAYAAYIYGLSKRWTYVCRTTPDISEMMKRLEHRTTLRDYQLPCGSITADQARLDISARSVWNKLGRAFFDVRVFHAPAPSNMNKSIPQMYSHHDNLKKRAYNARVIQVEKGTL
ncbi:hypothetical protein GQR58_004720 [Nymphon striatum]|nr:hypothetical protein GQR58_004720 [Nymphon striatum]